MHEDASLAASYGALAESAPTTVTWKDLYQRASAAWKEGVTAAVSTHASSIAAAPEQYRAYLNGYIENLAVAWANLVDAYTLLQQHPNVPFAQKYMDQITDLRERYYVLCALLMANSSAAGKSIGRAFFGVAPALVIGGVAFTVVAIAAAVAYVSHTKELRDWTQYLRDDLAARVKAMESGVPLPPSDTPSSPTDRPPAGPDAPWWQWAIGAAALVGTLAVVVPVFKGGPR